MKKNITTLEEHFEKRYGKTGTKKRDEVELKSKSFMMGESIKDKRQLKVTSK